jgi:hypothetical protein
MNGRGNAPNHIKQTTWVGEQHGQKIPHLVISNK